jgi:hypothetical protein
MRTLFLLDKIKVYLYEKLMKTLNITIIQLLKIKFNNFRIPIKNTIFFIIENIILFKSNIIKKKKKDLFKLLLLNNIIDKRKIINKTIIPVLNFINNSAIDIFFFSDLLNNIYFLLILFLLKIKIGFLLNIENIIDYNSFLYFIDKINTDKFY